MQDNIVQLGEDYWFCIDPGNKQSGWVTCVEDTSVTGHLRIMQHGEDRNVDIRRAIANHNNSGDAASGATLLIECPKPTGIPVAAEVMETLIEIGRILQMWRGPWSYVFRQAAKTLITGMGNAKDKNVTQALKDRFGGETYAVGGKKCKKCKGKAWVGRDHDDCPECDASGWQDGNGPGPLHGISSHQWAALLLGCWWQDTERVHVHDVAGKQPVKKKKPKKPVTSGAVP